TDAPATASSSSMKNERSSLPALGPSIATIVVGDTAALDCSLSLRVTQGTVAPGRIDPNNTTKNTTLNSAGEPGAPLITGIVASTIGTEPRSPTHPTYKISCSGKRNGARQSATTTGRATNARPSATPSPTLATLRSRDGNTSIPSSRNMRI